ncbi:hypothetical protein ALC62_12009, partial [Cyphomyrmex costatus]
SISEDVCDKTYGVNTESDPSRPVTPSCVIRQGDGYEKLRDVVTHCDETCMRRKYVRGVNWYFKSLLDGSDSAIEIGITCGKYAAKHTVEKHVCLLVGELLQSWTLEAPYAARGVVGDRQLLEDIIEASGWRRG